MAAIEEDSVFHGGTGLAPITRRAFIPLDVSQFNRFDCSPMFLELCRQIEAQTRAERILRELRNVARGVY